MPEDRNIRACKLLWFLLPKGERYRNHSRYKFLSVVKVIFLFSSQHLEFYWVGADWICSAWGMVNSGSLK